MLLLDFEVSEQTVNIILYSKFFAKNFFVPRRGLEPLRLAARAPQTRLYTISTPGQKLLNNNSHLQLIDLQFTILIRPAIVNPQLFKICKII